MREVLSDLDQHGYYNKTIHKCILKLHLPLEIINEVYKNLYNKNEVSGVFYVDDNDNVTHVDKNEGDTGSVYTPNNVINYHTHPINAYRHGKTAFGCPSGEDLRESLKFALAGNKAHLVFTVEGLYTIQVSPCKIKKIKELLNDTERGVLIFLIEEYFKTTHDFRCVEELNELSKNGIQFNPYSFVDFANTFDIPNLMAKKKNVFKTPKNITINKVGHSGIHGKINNKKYSGLDNNFSFSKLPNIGFPTVTDDYITTSPAQSYLSKEDLEHLRNINPKGEEDDPSIDSIKEIMSELNKVSKKFDSVPCNIEWNSNPNAWFFVNFFPTQHFINQSHKNAKGSYHIPTMDTKELFIPHEPFIRIFSNSKTGCKVTNIAKSHNFNMNKLFRNGKHITRRSTFGKSEDLLSKEIKYLLSIS